MAKAAYTAQFIPWSPQDLLALDVPLNRATPLYMRTADGGLGHQRLSDQVNLRKWSKACLLQERGGLHGHAVRGLLAWASVVSSGTFLRQDQGDFIGPYSGNPVWGSSLGALGPDTSLCLSLTLGPTLHPLLRPLTLSLERLDDHKLLRTLRSLNIGTWADLTTRALDGTRSWLDIASLLPNLTLPALPPIPLPYQGDLNASRPGQFWRLTRCPDEWAWGGIHQIICAHSDSSELTTQRWSAVPPGGNRLRPLIRKCYPIKIKHTNFMSRSTCRTGCGHFYQRQRHYSRGIPPALRPCHHPPSVLDGLLPSLSHEGTLMIRLYGLQLANHTPSACTGGLRYARHP